MDKISSLLVRQLLTAAAILAVVLLAGALFEYRLLAVDQNIATTIVRAKQNAAQEGANFLQLSELRKEYQAVSPYLTKIYGLLPSRDTFLLVKDNMEVLGRTMNVLPDVRVVSETQNGLNLYVRMKGGTRDMLQYLRALSGAFAVSLGSMSFSADNMVRSVNAVGEASVTLFTR